MKGSPKYIINKNFKKIGEIQSFVVENHQKMCPSWKDTKFYELGLIFII
mgnify:CR=1 FL=1